MGAGNFKATEAGVAQRPWEPPPGSTQLILVRHGASANATPEKPFELVMGRGDPELAPAGHEEAKKVAARLQHEPFKHLFVTPLRRTHETAAYLAEATGKPTEQIDDLIEVGLGDWSNGEYRIRAAKGDPIIQQVHEQERWELVPNGEPATEFAERIDRGLAKAVELTGPDETSVAVVHGGVIGEALRLAVGCTPFSFIHADNCSITRIVYRPDGKWLVRSFNDVNHMQ